VELLTVVAIIAALVALLLPAVQAARESSRRASCQNNLRQLGVALSHHEALERAFPVGCRGCSPLAPAAERYSISWIARILALLEAKPLAEAYRFDQKSTASPNRELGAAVLPVLMCPSTPAEALRSSDGNWKDQAFADYGGLYGAEGGNRGFPIEEQSRQTQTLRDEWLGLLVFEQPVSARQATDGLSYTAIVGESLIRRESTREWNSGRNLFAQAEGNPVNGERGLGNELGGPHPGGALVVMGDAHVEWLSDEAPAELVAQLLTRAGETAP
jgi:hypothetical protein